IDVVKLDQSFITQLSSSPRADAMVDAVIRLADALDLSVVAEGVEQEAQIAALQRMHCDRMQGFAISHPLDADALSTLLDGLQRHGLAGLHAPASVAGEWNDGIGAGSGDGHRPGDRVSVRGTRSVGSSGRPTG